MSNTDILRRACRFFASERWWRPVLTFIFTKSSAFFAEHPTHEEYAIFRTFLNMVTDLVDSEFCAKEKIPPASFENVMFALHEERDPRALIIMDTIEKATNFIEFRSQMITRNLRTESVVSQLLSAFLLSHPEMTDQDEISVAVTEIVQRQQDAELLQLIATGSSQMSSLLTEDEADDDEIQAEQTQGKSQEDLDRDDIERRRKIFSEQRDVLQQTEMGQKKLKSPRRPPHYRPKPPPSPGKGGKFSRSHSP
jgi:hypothetical protein